ncbi:unnamed protein product [[Candida] boidinii]|uniref:Unnamed protein product n=1 Tax=Candida boidinii TaxID=5477 RepID=A0ACB5TPM9_CANBO|nr:unnamed protein product [[Candida] boidinii]
MPVMFQALPPPPPPPPLQPPTIQSGLFGPRLHHPGSLMPPYKHTSQLPPPQAPLQQLPTPVTATAQAPPPPPPPASITIAKHDSHLYGLGIRPSQPPIQSSKSHKRNQSYGSNRDSFIKSETRFPISNQDPNNSIFTRTTNTATTTTTLTPYNAAATTPNQGQEPSYTLTQPPASTPFSLQQVDPSTDMGKSVTIKNLDSATATTTSMSTSTASTSTTTKKRARSGGSSNPTRSSISGPNGNNNNNNTDSQKHLFHYYYNSDTVSKKKVKQSKEVNKSGYRSVYIDDVGEKVSSSFDNRKRKKTAESNSSSSTHSKSKSK